MPPVTPSAVAQAIALAAAANMANLPAVNQPSTTWQTQLALANPNFNPAALVDGFRTGLVVTLIGSGGGAPTFAGTWGNFGSGALSVGYYKDASGRVYLQGALAGTVINTTAFTLPAGFRPGGTVTFPVNANNAFGVVAITSAGLVIPQVGSPTFVYLDGVSFMGS